MHCYICVTYMIILTSANPVPHQEVATKQERRSLFHDVIESLRIRAQLPEDLNQDDNNLQQNYDRFGYGREPQLPSDLDFIPRRNDRIEMPPLKYRFPKNLDLNDTNLPKEIVIFVNDKAKPTTLKPTKRPVNKNKPNKNKEGDEVTEEAPITNNMAGQSQIGNRESQTVVKPTVIVNIRGTVSHSDSDIKLERRGNNDTLDIPRNIFNINQEINLDREPVRQKTNKIKQDVKIVESKETGKAEEEMMMCESSYKTDKTLEASRKFDNVLQILFST